MNRGVLILAVVALLTGCAPISTEKVAATARPYDGTGESENFWRTEARHELDDALAALDSACASARECIMGKLVTAWPGAAEYQQHCQQTTPFIAAQCLLEYDFWAKMGRKFYPSYRIRNAWASFDLTENPTWNEWFTRRLLECDPKLNKSQEFGDACVGDKAKRDFAIDHDATKGCYYSSPALANFCYWMAGFDLFVKEQVNVLQYGA